jgi:endonuclease YncB( thermonuclease family)
MLPSRSLPALALALVALALAPAAAGAASGTVVRVIDGDSVRVREGGRVRTVSLLGVGAPTDCHKAQAARALKRLLPANARVQLGRDRKGPRQGRYIRRAGTLVNAALLRSGDARAGATEGLSQAAALNAAQTAAQQAGRGLWKTCAAPQTPPPPAQPQPQPAPPEPDPLQRARGDLGGRVFIKLTTTTFSSAESRLHLCSDGSFVEYVETYSDFGGSTYGTYRGRWEVTAAEYRAEMAGARVRRLNDDGTEGWVEVVAQGGSVTVNGSVVTVQASDACR